MPKINRQAGQNIRELALTRRIKSSGYFISAFFTFFLAFLVILNFSFPPIFYLFFIAVALWLIFKGTSLWQRANLADRGAEGEEDIARLLAQLEKDGWQIEYGIRLGNTLSDVDIFCVSPRGKFYAIDVKSHKGRVVADGGKLYRYMGNHKYHFEKDFLVQVMRQALQVRKHKDLNFVTPILAFSKASVAIQSGKLQNVYVVEKAKLISLLQSLG
ncbi:nuclease-related domain-containing protein [Pseudanabaena sp. UWO310]|uniref:nuclease-related domain-containing protein n=1 Tax=Pseudanabaena sp. UWO310 TaxID=2480795 RepID=UPI001159C06C|nr:nuclease-related domain-containing protein [Pseudanabaena sp. UWO310]TYQ28486.1 NERD domain-containing protein [Pseudanabaena sp. UWO310]